MKILNKIKHITHKVKKINKKNLLTILTCSIFILIIILNVISKYNDPKKWNAKSTAGFNTLITPSKNTIAENFKNTEDVYPLIGKDFLLVDFVYKANDRDTVIALYNYKTPQLESSKCMQILYKDTGESVFPNANNLGSFSCGYIDYVSAKSYTSLNEMKTGGLVFKIEDGRCINFFMNYRAKLISSVFVPCPKDY